MILRPPAPPSASSGLTEDQIREGVLALSREDLTEAARSNLDFLASLVLTDIYEFAYPPTYHGYFDLLKEAAVSDHSYDRFALGIPRGFSKTILLQLFTVWLILFSTRKFILVVCNTLAHARNFINGVELMLSSPNISAGFGRWDNHLQRDVLELKTFTYRGRNIVLAGLGQGGSVRGLNIQWMRPDVILLDDIQKREEAENPDIAKEQLEWLFGTLLKARNYRRCLVVFLGNMYPFDGALLKKLKEDKNWTSLITGAILADGESLWPEFRPLESIIAELEADEAQGLAHIFYAEVMNDETAGTVSGIDLSKIGPLPVDLEDSVAENGAVIIDPSLGKQASDDVAIGAVLYFDRTPVLRQLLADKFNPLQTCTEALKLCAKFNIAAIVIEDVAYQATLAFWLSHLMTQHGITGIKVLLIQTSGVRKNVRIRDSLKLLTSEKAYIHPDARARYFYELRQWNPAKTKNKDNCLDVGAYMLPVLEEHGGELIRPIMSFESMNNQTSEELALPF